MVAIRQRYAEDWTIEADSSCPLRRSGHDSRMRPLRRLVLVLAALLGVGCSRSYDDRNLLGAYHFDGSKLTVYVYRESGVHEKRGSAFNPNGPQTKTTVATSDLHRVTFTVAGTTATFTDAEQLLHQDGRSIREDLTIGPGFL